MNQVSKADTSIRLRLAALGGLNEIGRNMWLYIASEKPHAIPTEDEPKPAEDKSAEYLIVDAGNSYPGHDAPGVDYIVPECKFLEKKQVQALVLTSVHEAHSGGAHHLIKKYNIKRVVGSRLAIEQVKPRVDNASEITWQYFSSREPINIGKFTITPFHMTSSSLESYAVVVQAGSNTALYSGSYKIDQTRMDNNKTDIPGLLAYSASTLEADSQEAGPIDLYLGCSAAVENDGYTPSELEVYQRCRSILKSEEGRVIINTYSSNSVRLLLLLQAAQETKRLVAFHGQEIKEAYEAIIAAGLYEDEAKNIISIKDINNHDDSKILIITSAPEGHALRELETIAYAKSLEMELKEGDLVVNSADAPPGTIRIMAQIADQLFLKKVKLIGGRNAGVHSPTHAFAEEMKFMFNLTRSKYFSPVIGEARQLARHAKLAVDTGFDPAAIVMIENGDLIEIYNREVRVVGKLETGEILVNHRQDFHLDDKIIKERETIALEGVVTVSFSINKKKRLVSGPVFTARACTFSTNKEWKVFCLLNTPEIINTIDTLTKNNAKADLENYQQVVREYMNKVIKQQIGKKPVVVVFATEV